MDQRKAAGYVGLLMILVASTITGCSSITAPTLDPMQTFAADHAREVCILATKFEDGHYINYGVLVPIANVGPSAVIEPISFCNPAE